MILILNSHKYTTKLSQLRNLIYEFLYVSNNEDSLILKTIGSNIRRIRVSIGLSQSQLAFEANTTIRQIQRIEKGTSNAGILFYILIAEVLQVDLNTLSDFRVSKL